MIGNVIVSGISKIPGLGAAGGGPSLPPDTTTGGVVDSSGQNALAQMWCGSSSNPINQALNWITPGYCNQYWNEVGFADPSASIPTPSPIVPAGYNWQTGGGVNPNIDQSAYISNDLVAQLQAAFQGFFNNMPNQDPDAPANMTMWYVIAGVALFIALEK